MRPAYMFAILAVLFVIYTENQSQTAKYNYRLALNQQNMDRAQLAAYTANTPAGLIGSIVGGIGSLANLAGYGLE
jgi:hypothetical protein